MRPNLLAVSMLTTLALAASAQAGEGMWVPQQLPDIAGPLQQAGLRLSPQQLADLTGDPMGAVVHWVAALPAWCRRRAWW
ncbi:Dipeptidyl aminopeptidase BII [Xanthomonas hortorum pv. taraxaci]|nr:Dipeptidyl aminopeptidase BII [Xanthomonas hortorum pv. taraxaci]CAD0312538.1 Dipeptidyl aminopeptidase BII [Xanthomonas hortorum pv. taraxaci]